MYKISIIVLLASVFTYSDARGAANCPNETAMIGGSVDISLTWSISSNVLSSISVAEANFSNAYSVNLRAKIVFELEGVRLDERDTVSAGSCEDPGGLWRRDTAIFRETEFTGGPYPLSSTYDGQCLKDGDWVQAILEEKSDTAY